MKTNGRETGKDAVIPPVSGKSASGRAAGDFSQQENYKAAPAEGQTKPNRLSLADQDGHDSPPGLQNSNFRITIKVKSENVY